MKKFKPGFRFFCFGCPFHLDGVLFNNPCFFTSFQYPCDPINDLSRSDFHKIYKIKQV